MHRWRARAGAVVAGLALTLAPAAAALAHAQVHASPAVAGAAHAVLTISAEAESSTSGVASVRVVLPSGIAAADVALASAPAGWAMTAAVDGYTVGGPALPKGADAVHSVVVGRLPDETILVFKVLVTYADGVVDRWIEEPSAANPSPTNPAAVLRLAAAGQPTGDPTRPAQQSPPISPPGTASGPGAASATGSAGIPAWLWWLAGLTVVASGALLVSHRLGTRRREG